MRNDRHHFSSVRTLFGLAVLAAPLGAAPEPKKLLQRYDAVYGLEQEGLTVHSAGDINGDGTPDVIVGLRTMPAGSAGNHVSARLYSGDGGALLLEIPAPIQKETDSPNPVASLADLDGDRRSEFIVGTPGAGVARVFKSNGTLLKTLSGVASLQYGASVAMIPDADGDRVQDILVGSPGRDEAFLYSGVATGPQAFALLASFRGPNGSRFGASVGAAGAIRSRDPRSAVVIGAPLATGRVGHTGRVFVYYADDPATPIHSPSGSTGHDLLGISVDGGRDVDGDAIPDFLGGAMGTDLSPPNGTGDVGRGYVRIYSGVDASVIRQVDSDQDGDLFGWSAQLGGRCNGGVTLIVGAPGSKPEPALAPTGRALLYEAEKGALLVEVWGERPFDGMGISVASFSDINADSRAEFLAGAHGARIPPDEYLMGGSAFLFSCVDVPKPDVEFDPNPLSFGAIQVGTVKTLSAKLMNVGDKELKVQSLALAPGSSPAFSFTGATAPFILPPGDSRNLSVQFAPGTALVHGGKLRVLSNDPDEPVHDLDLGGKAKLVKIEVTPPSVSFGGIDVGENAGEILQVKNVGSEPLVIHDIGLSSSNSDFGLMALPQLPKTLPPAEFFWFAAYFAPESGGAKSVQVEIDSSDPATPTVSVPLTGSGVPPNLPPTAVIKMDVPYTKQGTDLRIQFRGNDSFDVPPGTVTGWAWQFAELGVSAGTNPLRNFPGGNPTNPSLRVVRLEVTDNGGKKDPTSVTVISSIRALRSRFYGTIKQNGHNIPGGTVVEAWIANQKVAESLSQIHHGQSVYAIDVPPKTSPASLGGDDGDTVTFKYKSSTAKQTGIFYDATDQELNLTSVVHLFIPVDWCIFAEVLGLEICGGGKAIPSLGLDIVWEEVQIPIPDPGPLRVAATPFELTFQDHGTGRPVEKFAVPYQIRSSYSPEQVAKAGIKDVKTLKLYFVQGGRWVPAGTDVLDQNLNQVVTTLDHASMFALMGAGSAVSVQFRRGDSDSSGELDLSDAVRTLGHLFLGGTPPACMDAADADDNGEVDISDAIGVLGYLFLGGRAPASPGPSACGPDPVQETPDLGCAQTRCP